MGGDRHARPNRPQREAHRSPSTARQSARHPELPKKGFGYEKKKSLPPPYAARPKTGVSQAPMRSSYRIRIESSSPRAAAFESQSADS